MSLRRQAVRNQPRSTAILAAAVLVAVALPVSVALPREVQAQREIAPHSDLAAVPAAIQPSAMPAAAIHIAPETGDWSEEASQSAYMVLVGSMLIGIGSIVRRTA